MLRVPLRMMQRPSISRPPASPCPLPQVEMEFAFLQTGYLLPGHHKAYWMGLTTTNDEWPTFTWIDRNVPGPTDQYVHWGTPKVDGVPSMEPNNQVYPENCATAVAATAYGFPSAWGWADTSCGAKAAVVCRRLREWRAWHRAAGMLLGGRRLAGLLAWLGEHAARLVCSTSTSALLRFLCHGAVPHTSLAPPPAPCSREAVPVQQHPPGQPVHVLR